MLQYKKGKRMANKQRISNYLERRESRKFTKIKADEIDTTQYGLERPSGRASKIEDALEEMRKIKDEQRDGAIEEEQDTRKESGNNLKAGTSTIIGLAILASIAVILSIISLFTKQPEVQTLEIVKHKVEHQLGEEGLLIIGQMSEAQNLELNKFRKDMEEHTSVIKKAEQDILVIKKGVELNGELAKSAKEFSINARDISKDALDVSNETAQGMIIISERVAAINEKSHTIENKFEDNMRRVLSKIEELDVKYKASLSKVEALQKKIADMDNENKILKNTNNMLVNKIDSLEKKEIQREKREAQNVLPVPPQSQMGRVVNNTVNCDNVTGICLTGYGVSADGKLMANISIGNQTGIVTVNDIVNGNPVLDISRSWSGGVVLILKDKTNNREVRLEWKGN